VSTEKDIKHYSSGNNYLEMQVATNGYFSFGQKRTSLETPAPFSGSDTLEYIVAPYWSDINTRSVGSVSYEIHTNQTSLSLLHKVSKYIREKEENQFSGTWMLVAEWNSVSRPGMGQWFNLSMYSMH
jgi:hypothetical protein